MGILIAGCLKIRRFSYVIGAFLSLLPLASGADFSYGGANIGGVGMGNWAHFGGTNIGGVSLSIGDSKRSMTRQEYEAQIGAGFMEKIRVLSGGQSATFSSLQQTPRAGFWDSLLEDRKNLHFALVKNSKTYDLTCDLVFKTYNYHVTFPGKCQVMARDPSHLLSTEERQSLGFQFGEIQMRHSEAIRLDHPVFKSEGVSLSGGPEGTAGA
jgi:hypothetical protein